MKKTSNIYISKSINDTNDFAIKFASTLKPSDVVCLVGDLGVGKTVIAKKISKYYNVNSDVISPTFNILKVYDIANKNIKKIYHYDLYRIKSTKELYDINEGELITFKAKKIEYIMDKDAIHIIEWPEIAIDLLPENYKTILINYDDNDPNKRIIRYE